MLPRATPDQQSPLVWDCAFATCSNNRVQLVTAEANNLVKLHDLTNFATNTQNHELGARSARALPTGLDARCGGGDDGSDVFVFEGHTDAVLSCDISKNGTIISGSDDRTVRVWHTAPLTQPSHSIHPGKFPSLELRAHQHSVVDVHMSRDGRFGISAGWDGLCCVWDLKTKSLAQSLHHGSIVSMSSACADLSRVSVCSYDGVLKVWDSESAVATFSFDALVGFCSCTFSDDGSTVAAGTSEGTVFIFDTRSRARSTLRGHTGYVSCCAYLGANNRLVTCGFDRTIRLWETEARDPQTTLRAHKDAVWRSRVSCCEKYIASCSPLSQTTILWRVQDLRPLCMHTNSAEQWRPVVVVKNNAKSETRALPSLRQAIQQEFVGWRDCRWVVVLLSHLLWVWLAMLAVRVVEPPNGPTDS